jgi:hypothetical protein
LVAQKPSFTLILQTLHQGIGKGWFEVGIAINFDAVLNSPLSTLPLSTIPAFAKRGDLIVVSANFSRQHKSK